MCASSVVVWGGGPELARLCGSLPEWRWMCAGRLQRLRSSTLEISRRCGRNEGLLTPCWPEREDHLLSPERALRVHVKRPLRCIPPNLTLKWPHSCLQQSPSLRHRTPACSHQTDFLHIIKLEALVFIETVSRKATSTAAFHQQDRRHGSTGTHRFVGLGAVHGPVSEDLFFRRPSSHRFALRHARPRRRPHPSLRSPTSYHTSSLLSLHSAKIVLSFVNRVTFGGRRGVADRSRQGYFTCKLKEST